MFLNTKSLLAIGLLAFAYGATAQAQSRSDIALGYARCGTLGDSLDGPTATGRRAWALKNYSANAIWSAFYNIPYINGAHRVELYPTYGVFTGGLNSDGSPAISNPRAYQGGTSEAAVANLPEDYTLTAMCIPGCFAPQTEIHTGIGQSQSISSLAYSKLDQVLVPSANSDLTHLNASDAYQLGDVDHYVFDLDVKTPAPQEIVSISFQSGGALALTPEHSVLTATGDMKKAKDVAVGDLFVKADGSFDEVQSAVTSQKRMRTYNLSMKSRDPKQNLVISNGYLTGSYLFQEKEVETLNRQVFRSALPDSFANQI